MRTGTKLGALAAGLVLVAAAPAGAHHPKGVDVDTIAGGLDNPRHVAVAKNGDVWVAESGRGAPTSNSCFDSAEGPACTGASSLVYVSTQRGSTCAISAFTSICAKCMPMHTLGPPPNVTSA